MVTAALQQQQSWELGQSSLGRLKGFRLINCTIALRFGLFSQANKGAFGGAISPFDGNFDCNWLCCRGTRAH